MILLYSWAHSGRTLFDNPSGLNRTEILPIYLICKLMNGIVTRKDVRINVCYYECVKRLGKNLTQHHFVAWVNVCLRQTFRIKALSTTLMLAINIVSYKYFMAKT